MLDEIFLSNLAYLFTDSQNGRVWKKPLEITKSKPPAKVGSPKKGHKGDGVWLSGF